MPEFQRQVVIPNVQKCSQALLALAKNPESEFDLKVHTLTYKPSPRSRLTRSAAPYYRFLNPVGDISPNPP